MTTASTPKIRMTDRYSGRENGQPFSECELVVKINGEETNIGTLEATYNNDNFDGRWHLDGYEFSAFDDRFEDDHEQRLPSDRHTDCRARLLHRLATIAGELSN